MKFGLFLLALAGCGRLGFDARASGDAAPGDGSSGTRLRELHTSYENGPQLVEELYDTQLGIPCYAQPTSSGQRCLPAQAGYPYYLDAACTQAALQIDSCGNSYPYVYDPNTQPVDQVFAVGGDIATPTMTYQRQGDGTCAANGGTPTGMWRGTTAVPLDTFAQLTPVLGAGTRVKSETLVADDGFSTGAGLQDTQLGAGCVASTFADGGFCEPYPTAVAYFYSDAACTHLVIHAIVPVSYGLEFLNVPACKVTDVDIRPVIADIDPMPLYLKIPGDTTCAQTVKAPGYQVLDLGAPLMLATITREHIVTGQRIEEIAQVAGEASAPDLNDVYDTQMMTECRPGPAGDGMTRCLPTGGIPVQNYFSDAGCTVPLRLATDNRAQCGQAAPQYADDLVVGTCGSGGEHFYPIGVNYTGPLYSGSPTNCQSTTSNLPLYTIGTELPASSFSLVTQQTAP